MLVNNLDNMGKIVDSSESLQWDGWDVIHLVKSDNAEYDKNGFFDKESNQWYEKKVYACGENGWEIPDGLVG